MVYGENLILNDDTYVGVNYLIPAFFSMVGLMNTTKTTGQSVLNELRDCSKQTSDNTPNTASNQKTKAESVHSIRTLSEYSVNFLDRTESADKQSERNTISVGSAKRKDYDFIQKNRATKELKEKSVGVIASNNQQFAGFGEEIKAAKTKTYDQLKNTRITFRKTADNVFNTKSNTPHFLSWFNEGTATFGEIDFRAGISYDDLLLGFGVYGDGLVIFNDHSELPAVSRERTTYDQLKTETVRETQKTENIQDASSNYVISDDFYCVSESTNKRLTEYLYITMLRERQRNQAIITSNSTVYTIFDKFASDVSANVNRFQTYSYMTRVLRLASYLLDGFVYNDGVYNEIVYGFADEREHLNMPLYTKSNKKEYTNRVNLLKTHNRLIVEHIQPTKSLNKRHDDHTQDNITLPLPVEPLDTPYQHPNGVDVEYGDFATFIFFTKEYDVSTDEYTPTLGFHHRVFVEDLNRNFIKEIGCSEFGSRTKWIAYVNTSYLEPWKQYYCTFTWDINGSKKIQRVKFRVVIDNDTMKHISEYKG